MPSQLRVRSSTRRTVLVALFKCCCQEGISAGDQLLCTRVLLPELQHEWFRGDYVTLPLLAALTLVNIIPSPCSRWMRLPVWEEPLMTEQKLKHTFSVSLPAFERITSNAQQEEPEECRDHAAKRTTAYAAVSSSLKTTASPFARGSPSLLCFVRDTLRRHAMGGDARLFFCGCFEPSDCFHWLQPARLIHKAYNPRVTSPNHQWLSTTYPVLYSFKATRTNIPRHPFFVVVHSICDAVFGVALRSVDAYLMPLEAFRARALQRKSWVLPIGTCWLSPSSLHAEATVGTVIMSENGMQVIL
ncbi:hypothetical protein BKA62DRAFT_757665 [Auriculariales sp. MPI-PUGE-AT-0066]|nr:hypothetical protein BKA62DRAFT_757665 [Auriculariales sp. MPI-PUGE-AT-0066]